MFSYVTDYMYFDLLMLVFFACTSLPVLVIFLCFWQVWLYDGISCVDSDYDLLELVWCAVPSVFVFLLGIFNIYYFYLSSDDCCFDGCVKILGRQWYWSYECGYDFRYDSMMTAFVNSVDKPLALYYGYSYDLLVTSVDVIHSFSVPDLGIKIDAVPGRINSFKICLDRIGVFVGYCTELCGAGHAYMPVVIEVLYPIHS